MVRPLAITYAALVTQALAKTHSLFSGSFAGSTLYGLEFDDVTTALTLVNNITLNTASGSKWIGMDSRARNLYVAATGSFQSYAITPELDLTYESAIASSDDCQNANSLSSMTASPYTVIGTPYGSGCSSLVMSVDASGNLQSVFANVTYDSAAGVHGTAISPDNHFIYSADDMGNGVWTHSIGDNGTVTMLQHLKAANGSDPRHLTVHPNGMWVYVVYEAANSIAVYSRDSVSGMLTFTNQTYSLLPDGYTNTSSYWADEVLTSVTNTTSPKYLLAATRSRTVGIPGYVSAFSLDAETGGIEEQLFLEETTNSGGSANAVAPAKFSEQHFAITDSGSNFIEVWQITDNSSSAEAVAHLDLQSGPANAVWYN